MPNVPWRVSVDSFLKSISKHVGIGGFEGFVVVLLEAATGQRFRLSASGPQQGQDAASDAADGNIIKVEAKHYFKSDLNLRRDLLPGLRQATNDDSDVDLWVLATSCAVPSQHEKELRADAAERGVEVFILDNGNDGLPQIAVLMAAYPRVVENWIQNHMHGTRPAPIRAALARVTREPMFESAVSVIRESLSSESLGFEDARRRIHERLLATLGDDGAAWARFHQRLNIRSAAIRVIHRSELHAELDRWWESDHSDLRSLAVLGEEGSGKTWAIMTWLAARINSGKGPIVVPFSVYGSMRQYDTIQDLLPNLLADWSGIRTAAFWNRRLKRWLTHATADTPTILLFADGLNERPRLDWIRFFSCTTDPDWAGKLAVLATDRKEHWRYCCASSLCFDTVETAGYTLAELNQVLADSTLRVEDIPDSMVALLRRPRYCQLAITYLDEMYRDDDFTVERLLYLDIKHRQSTKASALSEEQFQDVLSRLASQQLAKPVLCLSDLSDFDDREGTIYQEIIDGLLVRQPGNLARYKVDGRRLAYGAGLLLCDEVRDHRGREMGREEIRELLSSWFEPHADMALKASICWCAIFHSLRDNTYPSTGRQELIAYWLGMRNWEESAPENVINAVKRCPEDFLAVVERFWHAGQDHGSAQDFFGRAFLRHRQIERVERALVPAVERWLGFVHPAGPVIGRHDPDHELRLSREIEERVGHPVSPGSLRVAGEVLTVITDDILLTLARFGILILSAGSVQPFVHALARWALAAAVMGIASGYDLVRWVARFSDDDVEAKLLDEAGRLFGRNEPIATNAAQRLLAVLDTARARELKSEHPTPESDWDRWKREADAADPCLNPYESSWRDDLCENCMKRDDVPPTVVVDKLGDRIYDPQFSIPSTVLDRFAKCLEIDPADISASRDSTIHAHRFDLVIPALGTRAPRILGEFIRSVVRTMPSRALGAQYTLALWLSEVSPVLGRTEVDAVLVTLDALWAKPGAWAPDCDLHGPVGTMRAVEGWTFSAILPQLSPTEAYERLLNRPGSAGYPQHLNAVASIDVWFQPLPLERTRQLLEQIHSSQDPVFLQRSLWYLAASKPAISGSDRSRLVALANSDDPFVRTVVMELACTIEDNDLGERIVELGRSFRNVACKRECEAGLRLLLKFAGHLTLEDIASRVPLYSLGWFIEARGCRAEEVRICLHVIDGTLRSISAAKDPAIPNLPVIIVRADGKPSGFNETIGGGELRNRAFSWTSGRPTDFGSMLVSTNKLADAMDRRLKERSDAITAAWQTEGMRWFGIGFDTAFLDLLYQESPETVQRWVEYVPNTGPVPPGLASFLGSLCFVLFQRRPEVGLQLWRRLSDPQNRSFVFDKAQCAFAANDSPQSTEARSVVLTECNDDSSLSRVALLAEEYGRGQWIAVATQKLLEARALWKRSKGLTLASFSNMKPAEFEAYVAAAQISGTWVEDQLRWLRRNVRQNEMAQHWHSVFRKAEDTDVSWGALQAMLRCGDLRFITWQHAIDETEGADGERRKKFIAVNWDQIRQALNRDKSRNQTLFGIEIARREVAPFLDLT